MRVKDRYFEVTIRTTKDFAQFKTQVVPTPLLLQKYLSEQHRVLKSIGTPVQAKSIVRLFSVAKAARTALEKQNKSLLESKNICSQNVPVKDGDKVLGYIMVKSYTLFG